MGIGTLSIIEALRFNLGTARAMGPGYFPYHVGILIILLGIGIMVIDARRPRGEQIEAPGLRPLLFVMAGIFCFALLIERFGLVPAVAAAVFVSTIADRPFKLVRSLVLTVAIPIVCVLIFEMALGLQVRAFRWG